MGMPLAMSRCGGRRAIEQFDARMGLDYTSQEGEWLRARWNELQDERYALWWGRQGSESLEDSG